MANRIIDDVNLNNIANAIRNKKGTANRMLLQRWANPDGISALRLDLNVGGKIGANRGFP